MEGNCNMPDHSLNVEYIQKKFDECHKYTKDAKGRDLVPVIGNTGVGKSTICNYLAGNKMRQTTEFGSNVIETVDETNIKIGHEVTAETLYAQTILVKGVPLLKDVGSERDICLLDCPGFLGNRSVEDRVIETMSTEVAIRYASQIKGILILISFHTLKETRVTEFRELIKVLISLFRNPIEMVQYSLFIITKTDDSMTIKEAKDQTLGKLGQVQIHCQNQAKMYYKNQDIKSAEGLTYIDYDKIATYVSELLERESNIIFINPLDGGESRDLILKRIIDIKPNHPITIEDFKFSEYDEHRIKFNQILYERARDGNSLIRKVRECAKETLTLGYEIKNCEKRLSLLKEFQINLKRDISDTDKGGTEYLRKDFETMKNVESFIKQNNEFIMSYKNDVKKNGNQIKKLSDEEEKINTDTPTKFREEAINRNINRWKIFGWEKMIFDANTGNAHIPITDVVKEMENGKWVKEIDQRDKGIYKIEYHSNYRANPAKACVTAYIKTRDEAGNKIRITEINGEIVKLNEEKIKLENKIEDIKNKNTTLLKILAEAKNNKEEYKKNLKQKLDECEKDISHYTDLIKDMENQKNQSKISGTKSLEDFNENFLKYKIVKSISNVLKFPSPIIEQFVDQFETLYYGKETYRSIFCDTIMKSTDDFNKVNDEQTDLKDPRRGEKNMEGTPEEVSVEQTLLRMFNDNQINTTAERSNTELKDPVSGEKIVDLVITPDGNVYDQQTLLKLFRNNENTSVPLSLKDGSSGRVEYLKWFKPKFESVINYFQPRSKIYQNSPSSSIVTKSNISRMNFNELKKKKEEIIQEMDTMKKQLKRKETEFKLICDQIEIVSVTRP